MVRRIRLNHLTIQRRSPVAGRRNPTFLKRQKEQIRVERASAKRAARQARRAEKAAGVKEPEVTEEIIPAEPGDVEESGTSNGNPGS